jgi:hypothetical protein
MRRLLLLLLAGCAAGAPPRATGLDAAQEALQNGDLAKAEALLAGAADAESALLKARILLLRNRVREAVDLLRPHAPLQRPEVKSYEHFQLQNRLYSEFALACVRADDAAGAARAYAVLGEHVMAKKYAAVGRQVPYLTPAGWDEARADLLATEPLPLVQIEVNDRAGLFIVDTGQGELFLDRDFAREAGVNAVGIQAGGFAKSFDDGGFAERVKLGRLTVRNVPVQLGRLSPVGGVKAEGAIGLLFLLHFDFTIDYRRTRLVLRPAGQAPPAQGLAALVASDRHLILPATLNGSTPTWAALSSAVSGVTLSASPALAHAGLGEVRELAVGPLRIAPKGAPDARSFPQGLESVAGLPVPFVLGNSALQGRSFRLEPRSMRALIE